ncbi:M48 family metalloprotease [Sphingomonas sp. TZW2008]|uniref:M48 family metalloprotease n=1 Tax=Sphingomonas sp. TZW2008 TaxID=1917973 RepID=UPI000A26B6EF|nr:M48 family metalloprotease [Sphingomonas sp. TZW2008]
MAARPLRLAERQDALDGSILLAANRIGGIGRFDAARLPAAQPLVTRRILATALALLLASCGGSAPDAAPEITDEERAIGAQQHPQLLAEFGGAYAGPQARYVAAVGERIAAAAGTPGECTFTLVNSDVVNAFAVPGCFIYVTRGLLAVVTSEAELASVLGHEVGHIAAQHAQRQQQRSIWRTLGVIAVSVTGSERLTRLASQAAQYFTLRYSRGQEYEADDYGIRYLRRAGYDVYAAGDMLAALQRQETFLTAAERRDTARGIPEWALSHPTTEHRIARARDAADDTGLKDDELPERADAYLDAVDGLLWGDDPEQGFVLGRRFAHPIMRISFEAPPGFALTNGPQAIRLTGPNGISGEFGGAPLAAPTLEAHAEALANHIVGDAPATLDDAVSTVINGIPAVLLRLRLAVRDGAVPLSIAVYDGGDGQAYHFIVASPPANADAAAVAALFASFRRLSPEEAARLRPRFVRVVPVRAGDTRASLSALNADAAPRALFDLLNGGKSTDPLTPGTRVKIVRLAQ